MEEQKTESTNPLLARLRLPGETFCLPSQGLFYTDGELDASVKNGEVEVYPMTALDEIVLSTPDKLLSGKAIIEVFARCVPSVLKPEKLLAKDVDFLMACLRYVSFGPILTISYTHDCKDAKLHDYNTSLDTIIKQTKRVDPTTLKQDYEMVLPNGQNVALRPLTYEAILKLYETTAVMKEDSLSDDETMTLIVGTLTNTVKHVDGETDRKRIEEWVIQLPLGWKKQIEQSAQRTNTWGVDFKVKQTCKDCGAEITLEVTANPVSFFT